MEGIRAYKTQILITLCLNMGIVLTGFLVGWSSPVIPKLQDPKQKVVQSPINIQQSSWIGSSFQLGVTIGSCIAGYISNSIGRKKCVTISGIVMIFSNILLLFVQNLTTILVSRSISGIGAGMISVSTLIYLGEMASTGIRGMALTSMGVFHCLGSLIVYSVGPYISFNSIASMLVTISAIHLTGCLYIPESPIFYLIKGKENDAVTILTFLGRSSDADDLKSQIHLTKNNQEQKWKFSELFTIKSNRRSFIISLFSVLSQQLGGILVALYFTTSIFQMANSSIDPSIATIISGVTQFVGTLIVPTIVESLGRKTLMMASTAGCCFSMTALGVYFHLHDTGHPSSDSITWLPLASLMLLFFSYSMGLNTIPNTLLGELFRPNVRSIGSSIVCTLGMLCGFLTVTCYGYGVELLGTAIVFWIFAVINAMGFLFSLFVIPETKGLSLSDIQIKLGR